MGCTAKVLSTNASLSKARFGCGSQGVDADSQALDAVAKMRVILSRVSFSRLLLTCSFCTWCLQPALIDGSIGHLKRLRLLRLLSSGATASQWQQSLHCLDLALMHLETP